jgi:glycosyltransferase involved in cell wall biosynthesis
MDYSLLKGSVTEVPTINFGSWSYRPGVQKMLCKNYDSYLILGETRSLSTWLFCIRARLFHPKKKVYFWSHGWYGKETKVEKLLKKLFFHLPSGGVFLYGNYAKELMIKEGFNPDKLFVIHNSLAYNEQLEIRRHITPTCIFKEHFGNEYPNLIFIGRLTPIKKLDQALKAIALLKKRGQHYNMTFIGGGEIQDDLLTLSKELRIDYNIWFYGPCYDEKELSVMIYSADLCVSPGNVGLTAMHSMVFGTPVLTHNDFPHQMPEFEAIQEGITGAFFQRDDVDSLSESISNWFSLKAEKREEVRKACMKEIDENWTPLFQLNVLNSHLK